MPVYFPEWTTVKATETMQKVVARMSNRIFVGLPLCMYQRSLVNATYPTGPTMLYRPKSGVRGSGYPLYIGRCQG